MGRGGESEKAAGSRQLRSTTSVGRHYGWYVVVLVPPYKMAAGDGPAYGVVGCKRPTGKAPTFAFLAGWEIERANKG
jgi:hypothetical protein